jgi:hypothetical protein
MTFVKTLEFLVEVNLELERSVSSRTVEEHAIENWWDPVCFLNSDCSARRLLMVRIAEATLLCAGSHADNCAYRDAGDLLVNPREIRVHGLRDHRGFTKDRHGRLSEQLRPQGSDYRMWMREFGAVNHVEVTRPPLLPHMARVLRDSQRVSEEYLERFAKMQCRIADTVGFMAGWGLKDSADLWLRMQTCSATEREFALANMCRFDSSVFNEIGKDLQHAILRPDPPSRFLRGGRCPDVTDKARERTAAAAYEFAQVGSPP